ncbi:MAG TPA: YdeI/OmpD-associated family protein [Pyrinomonadaceae bacterium]|nr:YdeI/OmpD-associated family protein [Pyrinomonadaceae bacterium]
MKLSKTLYVTTRDAWRAWLEKNHAAATEVWLIYYKKHTGRPRIPYDDAVEEALCFGWIDSIVRRIDEGRYAQKFTPRRDGSQWSELNIKRARKLIKEGRMTRAGLAKVGAEILAGREVSRTESKRHEPAIPQYIEDALKKNRAARENFHNLAPSYRRNYVRWITGAKREETREKRLKESIELLAQNKKLGLK